MTTATVDAGASAVVTLPGACAIGLVIVLVPWLMTVAMMPSVPPQAARVPAEPVIDRSGSENPSGLSRHQVARLQPLRGGQTRSGVERVARGRSLRESLRQHRTPPCGRGVAAAPRWMTGEPDRSPTVNSVEYARMPVDRDPARSAGARGVAVERLVTSRLFCRPHRARSWPLFRRS